MNPRNACVWFRPRASLLFTALILTASSTTQNRYVEAAKLTSLGSTFDSPHKKSDAFDNLEDVDFDSMACRPPSGGGSSSSLATCTASYGVDQSFPIHYPVSLPLPVMNGRSNPMDWAQKRMFYDEFLVGCHEKYDPYTCNVSEDERMEMNLRQPASMFNYTTLGFHKVRAPANVISLLSKFWSKNFNSIEYIPNEDWDRGNTYTNHWSSPTKMLNVDSTLRKAIWDASKTSLEQWTGVELNPTSLYGVRVYTEGSVLAPHVDRMPLVISAIVNVAQDVDEPWPLEVYGHDGRAYNITMDVGDMIFYESHSVIHGRPFPLKGRHYANVFVHFEPLGHTLQHEEENAEDEESLEYLYQKAWKKLKTKCSDDEDCKERVDLNVADRVPHYIVPGTDTERRWLQLHPKARVDTTKDNEWVKGLNAHTAASSGDLDALIAIAEKNPEALKHKDNNGWNPLHEAVRGGHVDVAKFLLSRATSATQDKNERTHKGSGGSPLWWAKKTHGKTHPMVQYLESIGAEETPPDGHETNK